MTLDGRHSNLQRVLGGVMNILHISIGVTKTVALMVPQFSVEGQVERYHLPCAYSRRDPS